MSRAAESIRVLHVDDEPEFAEVVALHLERQHPAMSVVTEHSTDAGMRRLVEEDVDCVVSDHDMPGENGLEFLDDVRERYPELPFVLFTGKGSEEIASEAISAGVTEYLQKGTGTDQYALLANRIERAVAETRAKTALAESERMLSTLISNLPGMVYRCLNQRGWPMTFVSDGAAELTGYDPDRIERGELTWGTDVIVDQDADRTWERIQRALDAGEPFEVTYRIETADGDVRWMWERGRVVDDADGTDVLEGFVTDITVRKHRERELEAERAFTENVVNAIDDIFYVVDVEGAFVRWNDRVNEVTGYSDAVLSSMAVTDLFPEEHRETVVEACERARGHGTVDFEAELLTRDGERRPFAFRGSLVADLHGEEPVICGTGRDVSERTERERELERYETIIQAVGDPVYTLDEDGVFTFLNDAMEALSGYDRDELVGDHVSTIMVADDVATGTELIADLLARADDTYETFEMDVVTKSGEHVPSENHVALLPHEDGAFRGTAGVVRDITDRTERERRLEEFAGVVSHDLRNPLNVVQGRLNVLAETGDLAHLDPAMAATERMERLIDDLLRLARQGRDLHATGPVPIADVAADAWDHALTGEARLVVDTDRTVEADRERLAELFENLFRNAVEHGSTNPGSQARQDARDTASDPTDAGLTVEVGDTDSGFYVADDGVGVDPDQWETIFERGYTTGEDGTGFGLAIVDRIVAAHDWEIAVTEGIDGGARFEITTGSDEGR